MTVVKNKIDAIKLLESQGVLESNESKRCIDVIMEEFRLKNNSDDCEEELFFAD